MLKRLIEKIIFRHKSDSDAYIKYLRSKGAAIGERVVLYAPRKTLIDETRPWLLEIGDDVQITEGVTILTHGYDWAVLKGVYGDVLGSAGKVTIGNNVFIGVHSTILKGVTIGNNVIIGAASLVNKDIPDNCVVAGNPARVIMRVDEYYQKRKRMQYSEARELVVSYRERFGKDPDDAALHEFFWLFSNDANNLPDCWKRQMELVGNGEQSYELLKSHTPEFASKQSFLDSIP